MLFPKAPLIQIYITLGFVMHLAACNPLQSKSVPGTYTGRYAGGIETLELMPDGSYTQVFARNNQIVVNNTGDWSFDSGRIVLANHIAVYSDLGDFIPPPYTHSRRIGYITRRAESVMITLGVDVDPPYVLFK
jgi:hypothetical protein